MFDIEHSIGEWRQRMLAAGIKVPVPLEELESHLRDEFEGQMKLGRNETEAFKMAVQKIGQGQMVQNEFKKVGEKGEARSGKWLRILVMVFMGLIVLGMASLVLIRISFVGKFMLGLGLGFGLPLVLLTLVKRGILNYEKLTSLRRYVIIWNLILGALLTTPEILTQVSMAVALQLLYEASAWITWYWERQEKKVQTT